MPENNNSSYDSFSMSAEHHKHYIYMSDLFKKLQKAQEEENRKTKERMAVLADASVEKSRKATEEALIKMQSSEEILSLYRNIISNPEKYLNRELTNSILHKMDLPEIFLQEFVKTWSANVMCKTQKLSLDFIIKNKPYINLGILAYIKNPKTSEDDLRKVIANPGCLNITNRTIFNEISKRKNLSEELITEFNVQLDWQILSSFLPIDILLHKYNTSILWNVFVQRNDVNVDVLLKFKDYINWKYLCYKYFTFADLKKIVIQYPEYIDWIGISSRHDLNIDFMKKYADKLNWDICTKLLRSWEQIKEFEDYVCFPNINIRNIMIPEDEIEKHADSWNWREISRSQKLSEPFIRRHIDKVSLPAISTYQNISEDFREEFDLI